MKRLLLGCVLCLAAGRLIALDAVDILDQAEASFSEVTSYSVSRMTAYRGDEPGQPQVFETWTMSIDGEMNSLSVYTDPLRMRGTAYLATNEGIWMRFGSTGRVRQLSSDRVQNLAGSGDFSLNDPGMSDGFADDFSAEIDGTETLGGVAAYKIIMLPLNPEEAAYSKCLAWIARDEFRYLRVDMYDDNARIKKMIFTDYHDTPIGLYPFRIVMYNLTRDTRTEIETLRVTFDGLDIRPEMFTPAYLESME